jgi:urease accessory protein
MIDVDISRLRLLQLVSPALPVGAFAYSEGLEAAVHAGTVGDARAAERWIRGRLGHAVARTDGALLARLHAAWTADDADAVQGWTQLLAALRETRQLRDADRDMGQALARLLAALDVDAARPWITRRDATFPTLFALAAVRWGIAAEAAIAGLLWSWLEAQTAAAIKLVPLGQTAGQRLLLAAAGDIPTAVAEALACADDDLGASTPGAALAAAHHETLEVRLFRS